MATHEALYGIGVSAGTAAAPPRSSSLRPSATIVGAGKLMLQPTARVSVRKPFPPRFE